MEDLCERERCFWEVWSDFLKIGGVESKKGQTYHADAHKGSFHMSRMDR